MKLFMYSCLYVGLFFFILSLSSANTAKTPLDPNSRNPRTGSGDAAAAGMRAADSRGASMSHQRPAVWQHAILIDAGSSGSRIHVYEFALPPAYSSSSSPSVQDAASSSGKGEFSAANGAGGVHGDEGLGLPEIKPSSASPKWTMKIEPGISTFHSHPQDLADYLLPLLQFALDVVKADHAAETPLFLLATAGMRLLEPEASSLIASQLCETIAMFPFKFSCDQVRVISGEMEGIYGWASVNYLANTLSLNPASSRPATLGFLDLGGASAQITFEVPPPPSPSFFSPHHATGHHDASSVVRVNLSPFTKAESSDYLLYSASHLGFGANEARRRYLKTQMQHPNFLDSSTLSTITDPCLPLGKSFDFTFKHEDFPEFRAMELKAFASKTTRSLDRQEEQMEALDSHVEQSGDALPPTLSSSENGEPLRTSSRQIQSLEPDTPNSDSDNPNLTSKDPENLLSGDTVLDAREGLPPSDPTIPSEDAPQPSLAPELPGDIEIPFDPTLPRTLTLRGTGEFYQCLKEIEEHDLLLMSLPCDLPPCSVKGAFQPDINHLSQRFVAISEFWYTLYDVHGMHEYDFEQFREASKEFCAIPWASLEQAREAGHYPNADTHRLETQCFKAAWMVSLLHTGFSFPVPGQDDQGTALSAADLAADLPSVEEGHRYKAIPRPRPPIFTKEINGTEVSWTLGALLLELVDGLGARKGQPPKYVAQATQAHANRAGLEVMSAAGLNVAQMQGHGGWETGQMAKWYLAACFSATLTLETLFLWRDRRARRQRALDRADGFSQFLKQV